MLFCFGLLSLPNRLLPQRCLAVTRFGFNLVLALLIFGSNGSTNRLLPAGTALPGPGVVVRGVGRHNLNFVAFVVYKKLFHFEHAVLLLGLGEARVGPAGGVSVKIGLFGWQGHDREVVEEIAVIEDDLFVALYCILSVETKAQAPQGLFGTDRLLGLGLISHFGLTLGLDLTPVLHIHSSLERLEF